ncbi:hypothetical protein [Micromonospora carbonacea]|uniref:hypothetical protein n=1 Tax=Micromonospora carbonacea TaxID=47853 RepID=UPI0018516D00|nr:hypothetical protein [Micromonospora carbonacea]MBB5828158.1 hypothetical protein [Micromonospora carbonacea]
MSNLPFSLPECGQPATARIEVFTPTDFDLHSSLDASVYACEQHAVETVVAVWSANMTAHRVGMTPGINRWCGESYIFPTGKLGGAQ